jgi:hypothetical protein
MRGWADRHLGRQRPRNGGLLVMPGAPRQQASVTSGLKSEPLIPRRGAWNSRRRTVPQAETREGAGAQGGANAEGTSAARVRWNLSA